MKKRSPDRNWKWWIRLLFAAYGIAVGLTIISAVVLPPIIGWPATNELLFARWPMIVFTTIGGVVCYKYLH